MHAWYFLVPLEEQMIACLPCFIIEQVSRHVGRFEEIVMMRCTCSSVRLCIAPPCFSLSKTWGEFTCILSFASEMSSLRSCEMFDIVMSLAFQFHELPRFARWKALEMYDHEITMHACHLKPCRESYDILCNEMALCRREIHNQEARHVL